MNMKPVTPAKAGVQNKPPWIPAFAGMTDTLFHVKLVLDHDLASNWMQNRLNIHFGAAVPNISIKDVPETWAQALRQRAVRNHRSLQGELMAIIEQAALSEQTSPDQPLRHRAGVGTVVGFDARGKPIIRLGTKTTEQIALEHRQRYPEPIRGGPLAVDIIREDRDSR